MISSFSMLFFRIRDVFLQTKRTYDPQPKQINYRKFTNQVSYPRQNVQQEKQQEINGTP